MAKLLLTNAQKTVRFDLRWLRRFAREALRQCLPHSLLAKSPLSQLDEIEVTLISDAQIADVHQRFMQISGPTDVITFAHGEILISAETAFANSQRYRKLLEEEIGLYIVHGLLHLQGFDDQEKNEHARMHRLQNKILKSILQTIPLQNS